MLNKQSFVTGALLMLFSVGLMAQTPDTATLRGTITDPSHAGVAGAEVVATNGQTGLQRVAKSNGTGAFSIAGLPITGKYALTVQKQGFATVRLSGVTLVGGATAEIKLQLSVAAGHTKVRVTGAAGEVRTDEPQLGDRLSAAQMEQTPLFNRRITYLPLLDAADRPAINQGDVFMNEDLFNTNGTGRRQTWFEVDGSNAVDAWGRQTIFTNIPVDAVQEMTVLTNPFSAEYGFTAGGVVNIVTKSGGRQYHGDVEELWRPSATEAKLSGFTTTSATSGNDVTNDTLEQPSASVSGPLGAKTEFFLSGEYSREDRASPVTSPLARGNFIGHYRDWLGFLRVDHQIDQNNNLFFRSDVDSFYDTNPNGIVGGNTLPSVDRIFNRRTYSEELGETAVLSPTLLNNVRLQFQLASPITQFSPVKDSTEFVVPISTGGTFESGTSQSALLMNRQYELGDTVSATTSRHTVTFGGDFTRARNGGNSKEFGGPIYLGEFEYNPCTLSLSICESPAYLDDLSNVESYTQSYGASMYTVNDTLWDLFAQDDYHFRPDLTADLGLIYERQTFTNSTKDFGPRAGFAYNLRGKGTTVIRSGFGIYYSQIVDNEEADYALGGPTGVFNYSAGPGQVGFPTSITAVPLPAFPAGAVAPVRSLYIRPGESAYLNQFFPTSTLIGYPNALLSPYTQQWTFGVQHAIKPGWVFSVDYVGSHTLRNYRPLDVDPPSSFIRTAPDEVRSAQAANCTRPYWIWWYAQHTMTCNPLRATSPQPPYGLIQSDVNDGYANYNALDVNFNHTFTNGFSMLVSYTWSHTLDNVDPDIPSQNPDNPYFTGAAEYGNAIFDQRNRFVLSGIYTAPWQIRLGGIATLASGLPYNITTGTTNSGDTGGTTNRPVVGNEVIGRDTGLGGPIYDVEPFVERAFTFGREGMQLNLRAAAFNVFNHPNFVGYSGTWGDGPTPGPGFGQPLPGITNQLPAREVQFSARFMF